MATSFVLPTIRTARLRQAPESYSSSHTRGRCPLRTSPRLTRPARRPLFLRAASDPPAPYRAASTGDDPRGPDDADDPDGTVLAALPLIPFQDMWSSPQDFSVVGAYAIFDARRTLRYLGYSKNVATKLDLHARLQRGACQYFKVYVPPGVGSVTPEELEGILDGWVKQNGRVPDGNAADRDLWEALPPSTAGPGPRGVSRRAGRGERGQRSSARERRRDVEDLDPSAYRESKLVSLRRARASSERRRGYGLGDEEDYEDDDDREYESRRIPRRPRRESDDEYDEGGRWSSYDKRADQSWRRRNFFEELLDDDIDNIPILPILAATGVLWLIGVLSSSPAVGTQSLGF